jgi:hypothetical protein
MHKGKSKLTWTSSISSQFVRIWRYWLLYVVVALSLARWNTTRKVNLAQWGCEFHFLNKRCRCSGWKGNKRNITGEHNGGETMAGKESGASGFAGVRPGLHGPWYSCKTGTGRGKKWKRERRRAQQLNLYDFIKDVETFWKTNKNI